MNVASQIITEDDNGRRKDMLIIFSGQSDITNFMTRLVKMNQLLEIYLTPLNPGEHTV